MSHPAQPQPDGNNSVLSSKNYIDAENQIKNLLSYPFSELYLFVFDPSFEAAREHAMVTFQVSAEDVYGLLASIVDVPGFKLDSRRSDWHLESVQVSRNYELFAPDAFASFESNWAALQREWTDVDQMPYIDQAGQPPFGFHSGRTAFYDKVHSFLETMSTTFVSTSTKLTLSLDLLERQLKDECNPLIIEGVTRWDFSREPSEEDISIAVNSCMQKFHEQSSPEAYQSQIEPIFRTGYDKMSRVLASIAYLRAVYGPALAAVLRASSDYVNLLHRSTADMGTARATIVNVMGSLASFWKQQRELGMAAAPPLAPSPRPLPLGAAPGLPSAPGGNRA